MRIAMKIPINVTQPPAQRKTDPPLVQLAGTGERGLNELQGESGHEGEPCGRAVGLMSFERMVSLAPSYYPSSLSFFARGDVISLHYGMIPHLRILIPPYRILVSLLLSCTDLSF